MEGKCIVMMDSVNYPAKPEKKIPAIIWRTSRNIVEVSEEELVDKILQGYSIIPGVCPMENAKGKGGGCKQEDWTQQQIFALDFDDGYPMENFLNDCKAYEIAPFLVYGSYSDGKIIDGIATEKYRAFFWVDEVITDIDKRDRLSATLMGLWGDSIDKHCKNRNRYFNGTQKNARRIINKGARINADDIIGRLWKEECKCFMPGARPKIQKKLKAKEKEEILKSIRERKCVEIMPVKEFPDLYINHNIWGISYLCEMVENLVTFKGWVHGDHRGNYLFDLFNLEALAYGTRHAYKTVLFFNEEMFSEPLSDAEIWDLVIRAMDHEEECMSKLHEKLFAYSFTTILQRLDLEDEARNSGQYDDYFLNYDERERAKKNKMLKAERNEYILEIADEGLLASEIEEKLIEKYGKASGLVIGKRAINKLLAEKKKRCDAKVGTFCRTVITHSSLSSSLPQNIQLNDDQQAALDAANKGDNLFVSGIGGGVGKTFTVKKIIQDFSANGLAVAVCAATAMAASAYDDAFTFDSYFCYNNYSFARNIIIDKLRTIDTIIIDEISMLGKKKFDFLGNLLNEMRVYHYKKIQLIISGDILQLPPINDDYFFKSEWYSYFNFSNALLSKNIRQDGDSEFFECLSRLRKGDKSVYLDLNKICDHHPDKNDIYLVPYNKEANKFNKEYLASLPGELINLDNVSVKIGAEVIITKNNRKAKTPYYNGMRGTLTNVTNSFIEIETEKGLVKVNKSQVMEEDKEIMGFPIAIGRAITIHKSQGMTLESANIDPRCFTNSQLYVALSRVKSAKGIHLIRNIRESDIMVDEEALAFDNSLYEEEKETDEIER